MSEAVVRAYSAVENAGRPERFEEIVSPDYIAYGHSVRGLSLCRVADNRIIEARNAFIDPPPV